MNFLKSQSYNLSPDQYLQKFKSPHQIISLKGDPQADEKHLSVLNHILGKYYNDNSESTSLKQNIIKQLKDIIHQWMIDVATTTKNQIINFQDIGYGLKVFGSYSLKTNSYGGDIDMVIIVPQYFSRQKHFFQLLASYFKKHSTIKQVYPIPDAIVPLMRLNSQGVQIDLLLSRIKDTFMIQNPLYFQEDIQSVSGPQIPQKELRSVSGYRTAIYLKKNYVDKYRNYRVTLKAIKLWAMNKGIYSQIYGYLGGAAFSLMLSKICQLYPHYSSLQLLDRFFFIFANWVWTIPVIIQKMQYMQPNQSQMVIYSPLDPHMNSGHYISKITCTTTRKQLRLASKLIQDISKGKRQWQQLFAPLDFFNQYRNFIEISVMGQKIQEFVPWKGNIQSKIRKFIQFLQGQAQLQHGIQIHPYPRQFVSKHPNFKFCSKYYIGMKGTPNSSLNDYCQIDLTQSVRNFLELLENYPEIDKAPKEINIGFNHLPRNSIPQEILESFKVMFTAK